MKINKKKLGFTLVELLVVIAILAVLATVAIIGYSSFINEAHKSNDNSVVTELNHYLKAANPLGEKVPTATDAAEKLEGCGLNIAELQPSAKEAYYGYNYDKKEFVYVETDNVQVSDDNITTFLFVKDDNQKAFADLNHYSVYLQKGYTANGTFDAKYGLDVGEATVSAVNYTSSSGNTVVIRTNSVETTLTINAPSDTVNHFGAAGSVDIIAVANSSYHEYGKVAFMEIAKGRAALETGSKVNQIHISTQVTAVAKDGSKTKAENTFDSITIALSNDVEKPEFSRDAVSEIAEGGTLVVALQEGTSDVNANKDYVWLYQQGVIQQMVVTRTLTFDANSKATSYAETSNTYKVSEDIANNFTGSNTWENVNKDENGNITDDNITSDSGYVPDKLRTVKEQTIFEEIVEEMKALYEGDYWIDAHANSFAGGTGTLDNPYLVSTPMELALIAYNVNNGIALTTQQIELGCVPYAGASYKITNNINLDGKAWTALGTWQYPFHGTIDGDDGNGGVFEIKNMKDGGPATMGAIFQAYSTRTVGGPYGFIGIAGSNTQGCDLTIKNIKFTNVDINLEEGNCVGTVIGYAPCTVDFGKSFDSIAEANNKYYDGFCFAMNTYNANKGYFYLDGKYWTNYTYIGVDGKYYSGKANAVGVGNYSLENIVLNNIIVEGNITALDCTGGLIGKAYNNNSISISGCSIDVVVESTNGRSAGLVGYIGGNPAPFSASITNNIISAIVKATKTGSSPDYLGSGHEGAIITVEDINNVTEGKNYNNTPASYTRNLVYITSGNTFTGEIWYQGEKKN